MGKISYDGDNEYASTRLRQTIALLDGVPVYIRDVHSDGTVEYSGITGDGHWETTVSALDIDPFPLGYVNKGRDCHYSMRKPARYYKQGLNGSNFFCSSGFLSVHSKPVERTIMGIYPKQSECFERVYCGEYNSSAFSREFGVGITEGNPLVNLLFKGNKVGKARWNTLSQSVSYTLDDGRTYLQEALEESTNV